MPIDEKEAQFKYCPLLMTHDDKMKFCQGTMCMMWRAAGSDAGYCGLAGQPVGMATKVQA
jgi:hypothetical protein